MSKVKNEVVHPFALVYYLKKLLNVQLQFYDTIGGAFYPYEFNDIPVINALLNEEIKTQVAILTAVAHDNAEDLNYIAPYDTLNLDEIRSSWFQTKKGQLQTFLFQLETSIIPPSGHVPQLPPRYLMYISNVEQRLRDYALEQAKWDANQFNNLFWERDRQAKQHKDEQIRLFPENEFSFVADMKARVTIAAYYRELRNTYFSESSKSSVILSGALIEALLIEALKLNEESAAESYKDKYKTEKAERIEDWKLSELLDISLSIQVLPKQLKDMMKAVKDFRNFVHIQRAIKSGIPLDDNYKEICKNALLIVIKHVEEWSAKQS